MYIYIYILYIYILYIYIYIPLLTLVINPFQRQNTEIKQNQIKKNKINQ